MGVRDGGGGTSVEDAQREIVAGLKARRGEIERKLQSRLGTDEKTENVLDVEYTEGVKASVPKAVDYAFAGLSAKGGSKPQVPAVLLTQARLAARNGIGLSVAQRRYTDCFHLFTEFLIEEAGEHGAGTTGLLRSLQTTRALFDKLIDAVEEEYMREHVRPSSPEQQRAALVRERLAGRLVDDSALGYEFNDSHVALIARGVGAGNAVRGLGKALGCLSLLVDVGDGGVWAWFGKRDAPDLDKLQRLVSLQWPADASLGIGEVGRGDDGWRRTHQQARSAFRLALRTPARVFRYGEDPMLMLIAENDGLVGWLRETFLAPLEEESDGGLKARATLQAYLAADRNARSAAAALGVAPQTVLNRLQTVEQRLGRPLSNCIMEIDAALRLDELERVPMP